MRRLAIISSLLAAVAAIALIVGASAQGSDSYRFDVIFDDARGLVAGQLVKIAGAQAGTIGNVVVTRDYKARVEATVSGNFRFHTDAACTIRPQGLIAENYVDCDPGSPGTPLLRSQNGLPPTVPVTHTTEPVSLQDLFNIFNLPTRERFQVLVDELGIATAGAGDNLNDILRRANPALGLARQVISILQRQRTELVSIIDNSSTIAAEGAAHTQAVHDFITRGAALTQLTASHAAPLSQAIDRLPALLQVAQPALSQLDTVARDGTPLLANIRAAVPALNRVSRDIIPFANLAGPALAEVNRAITAAIPAIHATAPLVRTIDSYVTRSKANTALFSKLAVNLQAHGFPESFLSVIYYVASSLARYDSTSHMLSILLIGPHNGLCGSYATVPAPGCSAHYGQQPAYTPGRRSSRAAGRKAAPKGARHARKPARAAPRAGTRSPQSQGSGSGSALGGAVGKLLSTIGAVTRSTTTPGPPSTSAAGGKLQSLINYLLR